jgi:hypothetical protein
MRVHAALVLVPVTASVSLGGCLSQSAQTLSPRPATAPPATSAAPPGGIPPLTGAPREVTWTITSTPSGAAIWFDGKDTGARTPATFGQPAVGRHSVRLVLDGYADEVTEVIHEQDVGRSLGLGLRPRADVEREERTRAASKRAVDEAARAATRELLGKNLARASFAYERSPSIGAVPFTIRVRGDGAGELTWFRRNGKGPRTLELRADAPDVRAVFDAVVAQGFAGVVCAERPGVPDEVRLRVTLTNDEGGAWSAEKWASDADARFDAVLDAILVIVRKLPADVRRELGY